MAREWLRLAPRTGCSGRCIALGRGHGDAAAILLKAEADATRALGVAKADAYRLGQESLGVEGYTAMQLAAILGEHHVKLVPDISVAGVGTANGLASVLIGRMLAGSTGPRT